MDDASAGASRKSKQPVQSVFCFGAYCRKVTLTFKVRMKRKFNISIVVLCSILNSCVGLYKVTEMWKTSGRSSAKKKSFKAAISWEATGIGNRYFSNWVVEWLDVTRTHISGLEVAVVGDNFVSFQFGISSSLMFNEGTAVCGVNDTEHSRKVKHAGRSIFVCLSKWRD